MPISRPKLDCGLRLSTLRQLHLDRPQLRQHAENGQQRLSTSVHQPTSGSLGQGQGLDRLAALQAIIDKHPNPEWAPEVDQRQPLVDDLSKRWFGITETETQFTDDPALSDEQHDAAFYAWEAHFAFAEIQFADAKTDDENELLIWDMLGWECRDGDGDPHPLLVHFQRQMICATRGLRGRMPDAEMSDEEVTSSAEQWAAGLLKGKK